MVYLGKSRQIKNALKTVVSTVQYNSEPAFYLVTDTTTGEFDGYPVLQILPGDYTTTKAQTFQEDRQVNFILRVHLPLETSPGTEGQVYDTMYDLTDLLLDRLDKGDVDGSMTAADPTLGVSILNATRGDWSVTTIGQGNVLMCDVNVAVEYSKDL